jgi:hypothetical protein
MLPLALAHRFAAQSGSMKIQESLPKNAMRGCGQRNSSMYEEIKDMHSIGIEKT